MIFRRFSVRQNIEKTADFSAVFLELLTRLETGDLVRVALLSVGQGGALLRPIGDS